MLMVGIQNSKYETRVSLFRMKSAELPVSFVVGVSFLAGSISGIFIPGYFISKK